jgi:hypothetical protein
MVKDPVTRKRLLRPNPKDHYKIVEAPHLRITTRRLSRRRKPSRPSGATRDPSDCAEGARAQARIFVIDQVRIVRRWHLVDRQRRLSDAAANSGVG